MIDWNILLCWFETRIHRAISEMERFGFESSIMSISDKTITWQRVCARWRFEHFSKDTQPMASRPLNLLNMISWSDSNLDHNSPRSERNQCLAWRCICQNLSSKSSTIIHMYTSSSFTCNKEARSFQIQKIVLIKFIKLFNSLHFHTSTDQ